MIKVKRDILKKICEENGGVVPTARKAGMSYAMVYFALKGRPVGEKFMRSFLRMTGLQWDDLFYYEQNGKEVKP